MSDAHPHSEKVPGGGGPASLHDMALGKIVIVGIVSLVLFAAGIVWAYQLMVGRQNEATKSAGLTSAPTKLGAQEIGIVDQVPFDIDHRLEIWRAEKAQRLSSYGWVDRGKGIAHMPIDQAMQQVVSQPPDIAEEGVPPKARVPVAPAEPAAGGSASPKKKPAGKSGGQP